MDKQQTAKKTWPKWKEETLREGAAGCGWALFAFLLGQAQLPFDTYPLGIALLCAAGRRAGWMLVGLCASAFTVGKSPWVRICAYLFAAAVRILARLTLDPPRRAAGQSFSARLRALATPGGRATLFGESLMLRMATSCVTAFLISVWAIVAGGYRYYDLFGAFLAMVAAPVACLVYAPFFAPERRGTLPWEAAAGSLLCSVCYAVRDVSLFGISAAAFLAFVLTLVVTRQCGTGRGALLGALCGLCVEPVYAPLFCIAAGTAGLLWPRSATAAVTLAAVLSMVWGGYVDGLEALVRLVPALVCASIFVLSADRLAFSCRLARERDSHPPPGTGTAECRSGSGGSTGGIGRGADGSALRHLFGPLAGLL